ncbi:hypothetical protein JRQ81_006125 [Phrynocephalus forsythii]|uniref:Uncharacterized protein n=1 Tax=Phrynocephalus forsythii TaxID=171643 RepID=A0A9Q0XHG8_9SAUR|nr:hypothetical protein JRQ81_006125 [Phrynocephalus forsythii]
MQKLKTKESQTLCRVTVTAALQDTVHLNMKRKEKGSTCQQMEQYPRASLPAEPRPTLFGALLWQPEESLAFSDVAPLSPPGSASKRAGPDAPRVHACPPQKEPTLPTSYQGPAFPSSFSLQAFRDRTFSCPASSGQVI